MSALGHKRTFAVQNGMSALPRNANLPKPAPIPHPVPRTNRFRVRMPNDHSDKQPSPSSPRHRRNPVPTPIVRIDPVSIFVWTPIRRHRSGHPYVAEAWMRAPAAVLLKRNLGVLGDLRRSRRQRAKHNRSRQYANGDGGAGHDCQSHAAYPMDERHDCSLTYPGRRGRKADKCGARRLFRIDCLHANAAAGARGMRHSERTAIRSQSEDPCLSRFGPVG